jgi:cysteine desulfurase/selenocysteine lyase
MDAIQEHEHFITGYALEVLSDVPGLCTIGPPANQRAGVAAFTLDGLHPHDIAQLLDEDGIAVRAGHHCAMPLHKSLGLNATARASFYLYTTIDEIDRLVTSLRRARAVFRL